MKTNFVTTAALAITALLVSNYASAEEKIPDQILLKLWVASYYSCVQNNNSMFCFNLDLETKELEKRGYCYELHTIASNSWVTCAPEHQKTE